LLKIVLLNPLFSLLVDLPSGEATGTCFILFCVCPLKQIQIYIYIYVYIYMYGSFSKTGYPPVIKHGNGKFPNSMIFFPARNFHLICRGCSIIWMITWGQCLEKPIVVMDSFIHLSLSTMTPYIYTHMYIHIYIYIHTYIYIYIIIYICT